MNRRKFRCYIRGRDSDWEAICTDLDIAVQGNSLENAKSLLEDAVNGFLTELEDWPLDDQRRLLNRRSPFWLRVQFFILKNWHVMKSLSPGNDSRQKTFFSDFACEI